MDADVAQASLSRDRSADFCVAWESPVMRNIQALMTPIASSDVPILVIGEAGSGKEAVAVQIHQRSSRRSGVLRKVGCAGLGPRDFDSLLEPSEGGGEGGSTVFLDEI